MTASRYVVGIDLGTTNCTLAYIDTGAADADTSRPVQMMIPQVTQPNVVEPRPVLPSFLYLPAGNELPAGSLKLPWDANRDYVVGELARKQGSAVPARLISSAKSWLCHPGIDRKGPVLPWKAPEGVKKISPVEASTLYLRHLVEAWNHTIAGKIAANRLEQQEIILTVPASFDAVARELTVEAARAAGLEHITLLEEPQAAFYAWIDASGDNWRKLVEVGDAVLICDVGGGTTDLTLIAVNEEKGRLVLERVAVGDHILLGGDNMDLALAQTMNQYFAGQNIKLDSGQILQLWHSCRGAKEELFVHPEKASAPVTVLGRSSRVIAGTIKGDLTREELERVLLQGFFPDCPRDAEPIKQRAAGLQEIGLPYASDAAITRHLAHFLTRHADQLSERVHKAKGKGKTTTGPTAILFNGGVFKAAALRDRVIEVLNHWAKSSKTQVKTLQHDDLDLAVSRGAAYFGLVRRGKGVRIRGGAARSYYIGIETSLPAVPGFPAPIKALCVAPFGMEEGTESEVPGQEFGLVVGEEVQFRFLGSTTRRGDAVGTQIEDWQDEIEELAPLETTLEPQGKGTQQGKVVPVRLQSKVTEIGTLELWCHSRDNTQRWKLEFNVRENPT
jgi:hypothetical protein